MSVSDHELMAAVQHQDADAFEQLVDRYGETLRRHLLRMVRDEAAAGDLLQDVLVRVWKYADKWRDHGSVISWLTRIATNLALNHLDAVQRRREQPLEPQTYAGGMDEDDAVMPRWLIDPVDGPDRDAEQAEQAERLQHAIDALPLEKRTVFYLAHQTSMDMNDIARTLGVPEGTVKSRLHYTMKMLMEQWKELDKEIPL